MTELHQELHHKKYFTGTVILLLSVIGFNTSTAGTERESGQDLGMGRTFTASSRGLDALGLNPANLALDDRGSAVTFTLFPFGFRAGSDFLNYGIYNEFFTGVDSIQPDGSVKRVGKQLSDDDKQKILGLAPGGISHTQLDLDVTEFGITIQSKKIGGIGFSVSDRAAANLDLPADYLRFLLNGFPDDAYYSFNNSSFKASWYREFNLSYARVLPINFPKFKNIAVGIGIKYEQGFAYFGTDHYSAYLKNVTDSVGTASQTEQVQGDFDFLQYRSGISDSNIINNITKPAGTGLGLDFGISGEIFSGLRVAASITDLGSITWRENTKAFTGTGAFTITDLARGQDTLKNAFQGRMVDTTAFKTQLPTQFNVGTAFQVDQAPFIRYFPGHLLVAADLHIGFNDEPGNFKGTRFSMGTEYRPIGMLPIRTGISIGGRERFGWSFGFGINTPVWDLDLATGSIALVTDPNTFRNGSFTVAMRWRI
jgi:Family of unknown function (DUF5723)